MRHALSILILLAGSTAGRAADNAVGQKKAHQEIQGLLARLAAAESAGDGAAVAQCYEGDGLLLPSSGEPVRGREDIAKRYNAVFAGKTPRLPLESEELWVLDDLAVSRGATRGPAPRRAVRNRYVMTLKRHGDAWEIHSLVWNPAAAAGR
jgi:uncharacterized protein (TIGR02246 family)